MSNNEQRELLQNVRELCKEFGELRGCRLRAVFHFGKPWFLSGFSLGDPVDDPKQPDYLVSGNTELRLMLVHRLLVLFERGGVILARIAELSGCPGYFKLVERQQAPGLRWAQFLFMDARLAYLHSHEELQQVRWLNSSDATPGPHPVWGPPENPGLAWMDDVADVCSLASTELLSILLARLGAEIGDDRDDTKDDTQKKSVRKLRQMDKIHYRCMSIYRERQKAGQKDSMKQVVREVTADCGESFSSVYRTLNDHSDKWKDDTKDDKKTTR